MKQTYFIYCHLTVCNSWPFYFTYYKYTCSVYFRGILLIGFYTKAFLLLYPLWVYFTFSLYLIGIYSSKPGVNTELSFDLLAVMLVLFSTVHENVYLSMYFNVFMHKSFYFLACIDKCRTCFNMQRTMHG